MIKAPLLLMPFIAPAMNLLPLQRTCLPQELFGQCFPFPPPIPRFPPSHLSSRPLHLFSASPLLPLIFFLKEGIFHIAPLSLYTNLQWLCNCCPAFSDLASFPVPGDQSVQTRSLLFFSSSAHTCLHFVLPVGGPSLPLLCKDPAFLYQLLRCQLLGGFPIPFFFLSLASLFPDSVPLHWVQCASP